MNGYAKFGGFIGTHNGAPLGCLCEVQKWKHSPELKRVSLCYLACETVAMLMDFKSSVVVIKLDKFIIWKLVAKIWWLPFQKDRPVLSDGGVIEEGEGIFVMKWLKVFGSSSIMVQYFVWNILGYRPE